MTGATRRLQSLVDRYGESFTVGSVTHSGVFSNVTPGTDRSYMTSADVDAAGIPLFICLVRNDDSTAIGNTMTWNGMSFIVKKILEARFKGELCAKMLVLSQTGGSVAIG